jgi:tRNA(Met) C34 N-acetyltransferase TmcA
VATEPVEPLGPAEPVGDLLALHEAAGIELRLMTNLWEFWNAIVASTLEFSGIRLANARSRIAPA